MTPHPANSAPIFLCSILSFLLIIFCTKDNDRFQDRVQGDYSTEIEESVKETTKEENAKDEMTLDSAVLTAYELRTSIFPTTNDAHIEDGTGYYHNIVSLEEGQRTSYLMFDFSPIDSNGGKVNTPNLEFTIASAIQ